MNATGLKQKRKKNIEYCQPRLKIFNIQAPKNITYTLSDLINCILLTFTATKNWNCVIIKENMVLYCRDGIHFYG